MPHLAADAPARGKDPIKASVPPAGNDAHGGGGSSRYDGYEDDGGEYDDDDEYEEDGRYDPYERRRPGATRSGRR